MIAALLEQQTKIDADIVAAVENYCTPENISRIVDSAARDALTYAIQEEVKAFFRVGPGRKAVAEAVKEALLNKETYTILDTV